MKILFLAPANSIHTVRWVNALSEKGNQVLLVSLPNHSETQNRLHKEVQIEYLPVRGTKGYYLNAGILKKSARNFQPDIINAHYASGYGTLARIAHLPNVILSVWGSDVYDFPYNNRINHYIIKKNLNYAVHLASTSYAMAEQVKRLVGDKDIIITPFGVDTERFMRFEKDDEDYFTAGIIKTLSYKYGIDTVIKAFALFAKKVETTEKVRLLIYGEGEQKAELLELCKQLKIDDKCFFKGYVKNSELPQILKNIDVACFGSRLDSESFGVSAVEAMSCEVPVIVTDVDGFKEVVEDKITGYIVKRDSPDEMAEALEQLYLNKELRFTMGENGRERVKKLYDWSDNVEIMIELYHS
ncbi:glycosyltransferase [uncultured Clostridium sp.]|uniref:glycosyltransferase n=1 Tax=uncultured Clostridium sp. TaxID=59620 RepID=UPI0025ED2F17|nr:glycosyltransferase [uncultured Clostridium sp.]